MADNRVRHGQQLLVHGPTPARATIGNGGDVDRPVEELGVIEDQRIVFGHRSKPRSPRTPIVLSQQIRNSGFATVLISAGRVMPQLGDDLARSVRYVAGEQAGGFGGVTPPKGLEQLAMLA